MRGREDSIYLNKGFLLAAVCISRPREKAARRLPEGPSQELAFFWRATEITTLSREMRVARALIHDRLNVPPPCARAF